jgi:hypothetical protein
MAKTRDDMLRTIEHLMEESTEVLPSGAERPTAQRDPSRVFRAIETGHDQNFVRSGSIGQFVALSFPEARPSLFGFHDFDVIPAYERLGYSGSAEASSGQSREERTAQQLGPGAVRNIALVPFRATAVLILGVVMLTIGLTLLATGVDAVIEAGAVAASGTVLSLSAFGYLVLINRAGKKKLALLSQSFRESR